MKLKFTRKQNTIAAYCVIVFAICLVLVALIFKSHTLLRYAKKILKVLSPVLWGICIAYIINPFMMFCERHYKKLICKKKNRSSLVRVLSMISAYIVFLGAVVALIVAIIPEIQNTITDFFKTLPDYLNNLQIYISGKIDKLIEWKPELAKYIDIDYKTLQDMILKNAQKIEPMLNGIFESSGDIIGTITNSAWAFIMGFKDFILGLFVSFYLLYNKETYLAQATKVTRTVFSESKSNIILRVATKTNETFIHYFTGMAIDSLLIGIISSIALNIMGMGSFAVLIGIILGLTNMIPIFGPFIGAIPSAFLILLTYPEKTIIFILFILILQQIDGNIIAPKIIGNTLGLSPFWIMFAIFVGGGLFGLFGILIFVPVFAVIYSLIKEIVEIRLESKGLPVSTDYYRHERTEPIIQLSLFKRPKFISKLFKKKTNDNKNEETEDNNKEEISEKKE